MTAASLALFRAGHLPVMSEWLALPLIQQAGSQAIGDAAFDQIFHPVARRRVAHCDGCPAHRRRVGRRRLIRPSVDRAA